MAVKKKKEAVVVFRGKVTALEKAMKQVRKDAERTQASFKKIGDVAMKAMAGITAAVGAATLAYNNKEKAVKKLAASVAALDRPTRHTMGSLQQMAREMGKATIHSEAQIMQMQSHLLSLGKVTDDNLRPALQALMDASASLDEDEIQTWVRQFAIAFGEIRLELEPIRSEMLMMGLQIGENERFMLEAQVAAGKMSEAQAFFFNRLTSQFKNQAAVQATTTEGLFRMIRKNITGILSDFGEKTADHLRPLLEMIKGITDQVREWSRGNADAGLNMVKAAAAATGLTIALTYIARGVHKIVTAWRLVRLEQAAAYREQAAVVAGPVMIRRFDTFGRAVGKMARGLGRAVRMALGPVFFLIELLLMKAVIDNWDKISKFFSQSWGQMFETIILGIKLQWYKFFQWWEDQADEFKRKRDADARSMGPGGMARAGRAHGGHQFGDAPAAADDGDGIINEAMTRKEKIAALEKELNRRLGGPSMKIEIKDPQIIVPIGDDNDGAVEMLDEYRERLEAARQPALDAAGHMSDEEYRARADMRRRGLAGMEEMHDNLVQQLLRAGNIDTYENAAELDGNTLGSVTDLAERLEMLRDEMDKHRAKEDAAEEAYLERKEKRLEKEKAMDRAKVAVARDVSNALISLKQDYFQSATGLHKAAALSQVAVTIAETPGVWADAHANYTALGLTEPWSSIAAGAQALVHGGAAAQALDQIQGLSEGGIVSGVITGLDSRLARLQPGEAVVPKDRWANVEGAIRAQAREEARMEGGGAGGRTEVEVAFAGDAADLLRREDARRASLGI